MGSYPTSCVAGPACLALALGDGLALVEAYLLASRPMCVYHECKVVRHVHFKFQKGCAMYATSA